MFLFNGRQLISRDIVAVFQIASFAVIAGQYHDAAYPTFEQARPGEYLFSVITFSLLTIIPGTAYVLHNFVWVSNILIVVGLVVTGLSADAGHEWAAGNRAYQPISP